MARRGIATWLLAASIAVAFAGGSFMGCAPSLIAGAPACEEDDDNPCTVAECPEGSTTYHVPVDDLTECSLGANAGVCIAGNCKLDCESNAKLCKCSSKAECPMSTACVTWTCSLTEQCTRTDAPDGTLIDTVDPYDCKKTVCIGGAAKLVEDPKDTLPEVVGDCMKSFCDGMNPSIAVDNLDKPVNTNCVAYACNDGIVLSTNAELATTCPLENQAIGGVCNSMGQCVDCLSAADWTTCGGSMCAGKVCNGEPCTDKYSCKSGACADGICCNSTCTGECKSCAVPGAIGTCTNIPYYEPDPSYTDPLTMNPDAKCDTASRCNGMGDCLRLGGANCKSGFECLSGECSPITMACLGAKGEPCSHNLVCASGVCNAMVCD